MKITIETGRWAARYTDNETVCIDMPEQSTVADVIEALKLPSDETGIAAINGNAVPREHVLSDGDILKIYPAIIGG